MAEGGGVPGDEDNPFSFKKFVTKEKDDSDSDSDAFESDSRDVGPAFDLLDSTRGQKSPREVPEDHPQAASGEAKNEAENPFSFKKFLQVGSSRNQDSSLRTFDLANDLPDFARSPQQFNDTLAPGVGAAWSGLPDFAPESFPIPGSSNRRDNRIAPNSAASGNNSSAIRQKTASSSDDDEDSFDMQPQRSATCGQLPDFLSDSALMGGVGVNVMSLAENGHPSDSDDEHHGRDGQSDISRLRRENQELSCQLQEARELATREAKRNKDIQDQMAETLKREAEETKAMEIIMHNVEANLSTTTKRALKAEANVDKLKQEVTKLKSHIKALQQENEALRAGGPSALPSDIVRDKTKYASEQLAAAASSAEQSLKQLMKGVDTLKLVSDVLASIDTITDLPTDSSSCSSKAKS